jgi:hypothetical protein
VGHDRLSFGFVGRKQIDPSLLIQDGCEFPADVVDILDSAVETKTNCGPMAISPGNGNSCTFYYTVFFEGIPTLSQYGLAIMALLMLGVGFVGFRRFV